METKIDGIIFGLPRTAFRQTKQSSHENVLDILMNLATHEDGSYVIAYTKVMIDNSLYYAPKYAEHRPAVRRVLGGKMFEPLTHKFVANYCSRHSGSIIHAGTFFGDMLPAFSSVVRGTVFAYEPVLENYILARLCVSENSLENVILQNAALSDSFSNVRMCTIKGDGLHAGGGSHVSDVGVICTSVTIDSLNSSDITLIQLDVEGHELLALKGANETLKRCRPIVAVEDNSNNCSEFLLSHSYVFVKKFRV